VLHKRFAHLPLEIVFRSGGKQCLHDVAIECVLSCVTPLLFLSLDAVLIRTNAAKCPCECAGFVQQWSCIYHEHAPRTVLRQHVDAPIGERLLFDKGDHQRMIRYAEWGTVTIHQTPA
jgi:hypothetical protein